MKKRTRIKQIRTPLQKIFDKNPEMLQPYSWNQRIPEAIHLSIALIEFDYETVKKDFYHIADLVNTKRDDDERFIFTLSGLLQIIATNNSILDEIKKTCFAEAFKQIFSFYPFSNTEIMREPDQINPTLLMNGYNQLLDTRSETSTLCKYLFMQYNNGDRQDFTGLFQMETKEEILEKSGRVRAGFVATFGISDLLSLDFCDEVWDFNYIHAPFFSYDDITNREIERFAEFKINSLKQEFTNLYSSFKSISLLAVHDRYIAEINKGFIARICDLSIDVVELIENHKGEIAELTHRSILESFIVYSWLQKRKDPSLNHRFRDFSLGRERFLAERFVKITESTSLDEQAKKIKQTIGEEMGQGQYLIAEEKGDIFELRLDQMADEIWGKDNDQYFLYKRLSDATHGQWRILAKYHLSKSINPMHNGLYDYNEDTNQFNGLGPAFICLAMACKTLTISIDWIEEKSLNEIKTQVETLTHKIMTSYFKYFKKYEAIKE